MAGSSGRAELVQLLADRRYEDALELLRAARQKAPEVPEISRGIQLLKQRLLRRYLHQLGDLDRVPAVILDDASLDALDLGDEERELLRLVDGVSSFGDLVLESRFGRFATYRMLTALLSKGVISASDEPPGAQTDPGGPEAQIEYDMLVEETPLPEIIPPETLPKEDSGIVTGRVVPRRWEVNDKAAEEIPFEPPRRSRRLVWVGAFVGVAALAAGAAWWFRLTDGWFETSAEQSVATEPRLAPATHTAAPARVNAEPSVLAKANLNPTPSATLPPSAVVTGAAAGTETIAAANPAPGTEPTPSANPAPAPSPRPSPEPNPAPSPSPQPSPGPTPSANPSPSPPPSPGPSPSASPSPSPPPSPEPTPSAKPAPSSSPPPSPSAKPIPVASAKPARRAAPEPPPPAPPAAPLPTPSHELVEHTIALIEPALRSCYLAVTQRLHLPAATKIQVSLTIDEAGLARDLDTDVGRPPGLIDCVRETSGRLRRGEPATPLGAVRASFTVSLPDATAAE